MDDVENEAEAEADAAELEPVQREVRVDVVGHHREQMGWRSPRKNMRRFRLRAA